MLALDCHLAKDDFELAILLPPAPQCWDHGYEGPHWRYGAEDQTEGLLGKAEDDQVSCLKRCSL